MFVFLVGVLVPSSLRCSRRAGLTPAISSQQRALTTGNEP
jgi:hypothetical protein